jgi:hypothetical protein
VTLRELHERIAASSAVQWRVLPLGPGFDGGAGRAARPHGAGAPGAQDAVGVRPAGGGHPTDGPATVAGETPIGHTHRAVLRSDIDLVLSWGMRESEREYFEPWLGNLGRLTEVRAERILLDVLWAGSLVDRLLGLRIDDAVLPFPRSRQPRVKGLADRYFPREETEPWRLAHALGDPDGPAFDRVVHRSGLRVE